MPSFESESMTELSMKLLSLKKKNSTNPRKKERKKKNLVTTRWI